MGLLEVKYDGVFDKFPSYKKLIASPIRPLGEEPDCHSGKINGSLPL